MKLIVNSKYFARQIKDALRNDVQDVELIKDVLVFGHLTYKQEMSVHLLENHGDPIGFKRIPWYRTMKFLNSIEEQPVTVEIDDLCTISILSCEIRFKEFEV